MLSLLLWAGCATEPGADDSASVQATLALTTGETVGSVVTVTWDVPGELSALRIEYGVGDTLDRATTLEAPDAAGSTALYGLPYDVPVHARLVGELADGRTFTTAAGAVRTDPAPTGVPAMTVSGAVAAWPGEFLVTNTVGASFWVLALDSEGRVVWAWEPELGEDEYIMRARLAEEGDRFYVLVAHHGDTMEGSQNRILVRSLDGADLGTLDWPNADHDFVDLGGGTLAAIELVEVDGVWGDRIVERAPDGTRRIVWSAFDDTVLGEPVVNGQLGEWTHANALDWVPEHDAYYVQLYLAHQFVRVRRIDGRADLHVHGDSGALRPVGGDPLGAAHQFQVLSENDFLHFENGPADRASSRAVQFRADFESATLETTWDLEADPPLYVYAKGDVHRFPDGSTQICWATSGRIDDYGPDGALDWSLSLELGSALTYVQQVQQFGPR